MNEQHVARPTDPSNDRRCILHPEMPCPAKSDDDACRCTPPVTAYSEGDCSAFPWQPLDQQGGATGEPRTGLSKRELFAAMAMQGLADRYADGGQDHSETVCRLAVSHADTLLKELAK